MLRGLQTKILSEKISTLFDILASKANPTTQPILIEAEFSFNGQSQALMNYGYKSSRRRRSRRTRVTNMSSSFRSSWF